MEAQQCIQLNSCLRCKVILSLCNNNKNNNYYFWLTAGGTYHQYHTPRCCCCCSGCNFTCNKKKSECLFNSKIFASDHPSIQLGEICDCKQTSDLGYWSVFFMENWWWIILSLTCQPFLPPFYPAAPVEIEMILMMMTETMMVGGDVDVIVDDVDNDSQRKICFGSPCTCCCCCCCLVPVPIINMNE